ncbi:hypothetical protein ESCO107188_03595 [Escherichia coli]
MKSLSYKRIYKSQEYLATLGTIEYRSLFGSYSLTVDDTVFAMVSDGELYLRACEQSAQYCVKHPPVWLTYKKCGRSVTLNYYRVDESLWRNQLKLVRLSKYSLDAALKEKSTRNTRERRKRLVRTVLIFTESSDQLSRATDRVPGLPASPGYVQ